jgi:hypothetical protein
MLAVIDALAPRRPAAAVLAALLALAALGAAALLLLLPAGAWLGVAGVPVLGVGVLAAEARRGGSAGLPRVRHLPGE